MVHVKICGITDPATLEAAVTAGARYIGLVFFEKSPRNLDLKAAAALAIEVPPGVAKVALVVNASDDELAEITERVPLDMLQLHGSESPARVSEIRARFGLPVMKAIGISSADDLQRADEYAKVADQLLLDAKPAPGAKLPGGNGLAFDWRLLAGHKWQKPWMLAGGLTAQNVARAINRTGAAQVDVSSGVESAPGIKDASLIGAFIRAASA